MASVASLFIIAIFAFNLLCITFAQILLQSPAVREIETLEIEDGVERDEFIGAPLRQRRSPSEDYYNDYSDDSNSRHLKLGHKRKKHRKPLLLSLLGGQGGCRGYDCDGGHGWQPQSQGSHGNQGGSFASASAGSSHYGGQSQANAQSASFNFGPYSATFSTAQASAGNRNDAIRDYYDY